MFRFHHFLPPAFVFLAVSCALVARAEEKPAAATAERKADFATDIQPLLQKNCYSCHGAEHQEGGLRLDVKKRALEGGDSGVEIVPGKSAESRLARVIAGIDDEFGRMPPEEKGTPLTADQIGLIRAWIDQGARWPDDGEVAAAGGGHWSLQPVAAPALPTVRDASWLKQPIDAFIAARHEAEKIRPSRPAERTTLLRRLHLDLIGLPPSPDEVATFLGDTHPDATSRQVDRLLASPHFGERWGRHWLDLARYADSDGYEKDRPRPFAYRYRDWVIATFNADMPYDQFTIEQLAGDMLPDATEQQQIAAGLHRNTLHNTEGGTDPEEDRVKKTVDRTNTLGVVWLGLTVGCAQCHTHKYDPITQREYFSLYAFFNNLDEKDLETPTSEQAGALTELKEGHAKKLRQLEAAVKAYEKDKLPAAQQAWEESLAGLSAQQVTAKNVPAAAAAALQVPLAERTAEQAKQIAAHFRSLDKQLAKLEAAVTAHKTKPPQLPAEAKAQSVAERSEPRTTKIHLRGDFLSPGDPVAASTLAVLPPLVASDDSPDRIDLARWVVNPANPLTARVAVNRIWHQLFGRGIVPTLDDFGKQGEKPSHPELLDWLAGEFVAGNWSQKSLIRRLVLSATYQQSSAPRRDLAIRDPENIWLARQVRRRVESEVIRDLALAASGQLTPRIGGPSVRPPQPAEYATLTYANSAKWVESKGEDRYRRGMYTFFQRTSPYPMLMTFDTPDSNECAASRQTSNTPLQALTIWNDPAFFESAQALGRRIIADVPEENTTDKTVRLRSQRAFLLCLARVPSAAELSDVRTLYEAARDLASKDNAAALELIGGVEPTSVSIAELAAWVSVGRTLLNLDEFITRE